ncbi:Kelch repeat type 1 [Arabidopsis suecica]|uniref:Kelch repeat type 1 n=1 Tax=Arabidopsis suecica TaxID=45249 RepID=A0A8T1ZZW3_ARASU|nr:Kelch repeat type 1 [Arabidopsis suecica]
MSPEKKRKIKVTMKEKKMIKKKLKPSVTQQSILISSLPDDLILSCVARVSRLYYPTLSLVSKSFRSLLASPELYKARSLLGRTESCLYVCLSPNPPFSSCALVEDILMSGYRKILWSTGESCLVAIGSDIYNIGGCRKIYETPPSSSVWILDCMSHTWREAPSLPVEPIRLSASVLDGKIYVAGSKESLENLFEVFDTKTQTWDPESSIPCSKTKDIFLWSKSTCIDGKFHVVVDRRGVVSHMGAVIAYNCKEGRWDMVEQNMECFKFSSSHCEIDNVLYCVLHGAIKWYDTKVRLWRRLKGLVKLPKFSYDACIKLADYGGKIAVLWVDESSYSGGKTNKIWCAEIALERRRQNCEIWGEVEWFGHVLTVPSTCVLEKVLAVTV